MNEERKKELQNLFIGAMREVKEEQGAKKKRIYSIIGQIFIGLALIFILIYSFVVIKNPSETFPRDIFGLPIPEPPVWTSYIPYFGVVLTFIFEFFSLHGLVEVAISVSFIFIGMKFITKE